jgi:mannose-1-phosphate guanylyltransferase
VTRFAAILSGGVGERFWPASTPERPKQLLPLLGPRTMLRETLERIAPELPPERVLIVTSAALAAAVSSECPEVPPANVIAEPRGRNTAPAVAAAACAALALGGPEASLAVLPADHLVREREAFLGALRRAFAAAESGPLIVTLGIRPNRPETGYGYITRGEPIEESLYRIEAFHEKPNEATALALLEEGRSYWNAGIFVAAAGTFVQEIRRHAPDVGGPMEALLEVASVAAREAGPATRREAASGLTDPGDSPVPSGVDPRRWQGGVRELYAGALSIAFDVAVMERTETGAVLPVDIGWDDVGSWDAVARLLEADPSGNVVRGAGRLLDARNNILFAEEGRITVIGASDLVIVRSGAETFVCARDRLPELKELLRSLSEDGGQARAARPGKITASEDRNG